MNTRVDHPGTLLDLTSECAEVIRGVGAPSFRLLYDVYHSLAMGENPRTELSAARDLVSHVQIADVPGHGEPGSGMADWPARLAELRDCGYDGPLGLEYYPTTGTLESLQLIRSLTEESP